METRGNLLSGAIKNHQPTHSTNKQTNKKWRILRVLSVLTHKCRRPIKLQTTRTHKAYTKPRKKNFCFLCRCYVHLMWLLRQWPIAHQMPTNNTIFKKKTRIERNIAVVKNRTAATKKKGKIENRTENGRQRECIWITLEWVNGIITVHRNNVCV